MTRKPAPHRISLRSTLLAALVVLLVGPFLLPSPCTAGDGEAEASVALIASDGPAQRYWPRWQGPSGQGYVANETAGYALRWSGTEDALWKTPVSGRGNSSPVVWGDRIFLTTAYDGGARRSILSGRAAPGARA